MIQRKGITISKDEVIKLQWDWSAELEQRDTTLSSSTWATTDSSIVLSSQTISGNKALVTLTANNDPRNSASLTNTVVLANGETLVAGAYYQ